MNTDAKVGLFHFANDVRLETRQDDIFFYHFTHHHLDKN